MSGAVGAAGTPSVTVVVAVAGVAAIATVFAGFVDPPAVTWKSAHRPKPGAVHWLEDQTGLENVTVIV